MTSQETIRHAVSTFLRESVRPVLFAGAGVSTHAGLPTWDAYLTGLAEQIRPHDALTRHQMIECIRTRQYSRAAEYFFLSEGLTDGEKYAALTSPLLEYDPSTLASLAALNFSSYVTTNYDRVLHDLYAGFYRKSAAEVNLGDPTMKAAPFQETFYVARIHGRVEVPTSMVLSRAHYANLEQDTAYIDFLRHLFCGRSLLFIGFSFLDPAIRTVLTTVQAQLGPIHAGRHLALVDNDADAEFLAELNRHNIRVVRYASVNGHAALWHGLKQVPSSGDESAAPPNAVTPDAFAYARQYLAAALTRRKMGAHLRPLTQAVAEGMVLEMLRRAGNAGMSHDNLQRVLAEQLNLRTSASAELLNRSLQGLAADLLYVVEADGSYRAIDSNGIEGNFSAAIDVLVDGAIQRFVVREQGKETSESRRLLARYFEYMVLRRGWDMGAAYAAGRPPQVVVVDDILGHLSRETGSERRPSLSMVRAIEGVLLSPSDDEANVLAELGRLAFALELVRKTPQDTLFSSHVLPTRVYLDANVLMPAIVEGHPFNELYSAAMDRLLTASVAASSTLEVCAYYGFLNEIVSHRRRACDEINDYGSRAAEYIEREVRLYGSANLNVFVAGFARTLMAGEHLTFDEYLRRFAPYRTEKELATWLQSRGVRVIDQKEMMVAAPAYPTLLHHFETMFVQELISRVRTAQLIAHDAIQIARLVGDVSMGQRAVFVTADRKLRDAVAYSDFQHIGAAMLSGVGLVQTIDLLVGAIGDGPAMASLLWATQASNTAERIRRYLIDVALSQYDAALAMNIESIVQELTEDIAFAVEQDRDRRQPSEEGGLSLSKYVEAFEPRFYELMRAEQLRLGSRE